MGRVPAARYWSTKELRSLRGLANPWGIQAYLDSIPYNVSAKTLSPRAVLRQRRAHCFDGALFAAAALEVLGEPPLVMDLRSNGRDDDHVLAIYRRDGCWGAIGKSNYTGCRSREPVYRTLRELAMSYFHVYFNLAGERTLREYSTRFDLRRLSDGAWRTSDEDLSGLGERLDAVRHFRLIAPKQERLLTKADARLFKAETLGIDTRGAFKL